MKPGSCVVGEKSKQLPAETKRRFLSFYRWVLLHPLFVCGTDQVWKGTIATYKRCTKPPQSWRFECIHFVFGLAFCDFLMQSNNSAEYWFPVYSLWLGNILRILLWIDPSTIRYTFSIHNRTALDLCQEQNFLFVFPFLPNIYILFTAIRVYWYVIYLNYF